MVVALNLSSGDFFTNFVATSMRLPPDWELLYTNTGRSYFWTGMRDRFQGCYFLRVYVSFRGVIYDSL